jgi:hypothetical protein
VVVVFEQTGAVAVAVAVLELELLRTELALWLVL